MFMVGRQGRERQSGRPTVAGNGPISPATDQATLYYVAANGLGLVERQVQLPSGAAAGVSPGGAYDPIDRSRSVLEAQLAPPPPPLISPFPADTRVRAVYLTPAGDAFVDLTADVTHGHGGGSLDELLTVYALVNALTMNVPEISAVQILVEGREVDTLVGHVDLRQPLARNMGLVASRGPDTARPPAAGVVSE